MKKGKKTNIEIEEKGINIMNERSLHAQLKEQYAKPGDRFEAKVNNYIVDIVREEELIEIQTRNLGKIASKVKDLAIYNHVRIVYPICQERWIVYIDPITKEKVSRRKSPLRGNLYDVFDELVRLPALIHNKNIMLEILLIKEEEVRCRDGKGSWRRKGISIVDRQLLEICEKISFASQQDFMNLLPDHLPIPFTNKILAESLKIPVSKSRKMTYTLKKMGGIKEIGRIGRELAFERRTGENGCEGELA